MRYLSLSVSVSVLVLVLVVVLVVVVSDVEERAGYLESNLLQCGPLVVPPWLLTNIFKVGSRKSS